MIIIHPLKNKEAVISSPFGMRIHPITKKEKMHNGTDYSVPLETPIYAVVDFIDYHILWQENGAGHYIKASYITPQKNNIQIYYMHLLKALYLKDVKQGDLIGYTGNSGASLGAHLHFEIRVNGQSVEPTQFIC